MFGSIVAVFASAVILIATFFVLWGLGQARVDLFGKSLIVLLAVTELVALVSTWLWAMKWRTLGLSSPWRFVIAPRPATDPELAAWRWGRRAWAAWVIIMACIVLLAITVLG